VLSLQQMFCVFPMHVNTIFNSFSHTKCIVFQKFSRQAFSTRCCNTYTSFPGLNTLKSRGLRSKDRAGQLTGPPRPAHCRLKVCFMSCLTMRGHIRTWVYLDPGNDVEVLRQRVENTCHEITAKSGIFEKIHISYEKQIRKLC
jgi:hypothetical protein